MLIQLLAAQESSYKDKIVELQNKNQALQKQLTALEERLDELDDHVEEVETATLVDKIKLNLGFNVKMNNYNKKFASGREEDTKNHYSTKLSIGLKSNITDNMKFIGKVSMYKNWADSTKHFYTQFDSMQGRVPADSALYVERAYIDWIFKLGTINSALTLGRQPTSDGPSHQFKANTKRKSTYSALVFDGASDGIVYTADVSKLSTIDKARLRFAYGKGFQDDETSPMVQNAFIGSYQSTLKDTDVYGAFFESSIWHQPNTLFQIGYVKIQDIIANALDGDKTKNKNIGDVDFVGLMLEGSDIKESGIDLFFHYGTSIATAQGENYSYAGQTMGLLRDNNQDTQDKNGYAYWLGGRYTFENFYDMKVGAEYNHGSRYWVTASQGAYDTSNKLATRGDAYELYSILPINRYSFIKLGFVNINYNYTNSGWFLSKPQKISELTTNKDRYMSELNNIYLEFNVKY